MTRPCRSLCAAVVLLVSVFACAVAPCAASDNRDAPATRHDDDVSHAIDLHDRLADIEIEHNAGEPHVVLRHNGQTQRLTASAYLSALEQQRHRQREQGWVFVLFNITGWHGVLWVTLGMTGQLIFTGRMIVQWVISEKEHRSVVPPVFWWMSLVGASMLLAYFLWRKDIVGVVGQGGGWLIYARNLWMIHHPAIFGGIARQASNS